MHVSLVVATVGRVKELDRLFASLTCQSYRHFDVVLVDQNLDERLGELIRRFKGEFPITWLRVSECGVSRARNEGLAHAQGEIVGFPDDDCWYPEDLLYRVVEFFRTHSEYDGLAGQAIDESGRPSVGRWATKKGEITRFNEWTRTIEFALFFRRKVVVAVGGFDPTLGPGAGTPWGACEGDDLVLRLLAEGSRIFYDPSLAVIHPSSHSWAERARRARSYGSGMGRVLRMHRYPTWFFVYWCLRSLGGLGLAALNGDPDRAAYYWQTLLGRIEGWLSVARHAEIASNRARQIEDRRERLIARKPNSCERRSR